jgi:hypothetical protein
MAMRCLVLLLVVWPLLQSCTKSYELTEPTITWGNSWSRVGGTVTYDTLFRSDCKLYPEQYEAGFNYSSWEPGSTWYTNPSAPLSLGGNQSSYRTILYASSLPIYVRSYIKVNGKVYWSPQFTVN